MEMREKKKKRKKKTTVNDSIEFAFHCIAFIGIFLLSQFAVDSFSWFMLDIAYCIDQWT